MKPEFNSLKQRIQNLLASPEYRPMRVSEIISALKIPPAERGNIRRILDALLQKGVIVRIRKDRIVLPSEADLVTGRLDMNERGFGFVIPETPTASPDLFIAAEDTEAAMHGDRVVARIHERGGALRKQTRGKSADRLCGRVIRVLERANPTLVGVLQRSQSFHCVVPDDPRLFRSIYVDLARSSVKARAGDRVVVRLHEWENRRVNPEGTLIEVLGRADDPKLDVLVIVKKFRFRVDFPDDVLAQAETIEESISDVERQRRMDLRNDLIVTIDPEDARDHDDALSLRERPDGRWRLGVHIADVSHFVKAGSPLDREARERGNSIYLPDRVIPMLPPRLSNEICSLKEGVERLAQSVFFEIDGTGAVHHFSFHDTIIRSSARLTYSQALLALQPSAVRSPALHDPALCKLLRNLETLALRVRRLRFANGSLDLDFPELKVHCDDKGIPLRIEKRESDVSHQLVEECMLLANEAVAAEIRRRTIPGIYRIHEDPDPEKLEEYRDFVVANGHSMGDPAVRGEIQKLLKKLRGAPEEYIFKLNFLRSLKRAQYSTHPLGHFGLAKENYTHFTSPIRRYADLIVHRSLLRATRSQRHPPPSQSRFDAGYDTATLETIAHHCSTTERMADEAEKEAVKLKLIEYFERQLQNRRHPTFDALITEARNFGLFVELPEFMLSGLVHVSTLEDDFYQFDPARRRLVGKRSRRILQPGDHIRVEVARVDRFKKLVDFRLSE